MNAVTKIACRTLGVTGMGVALYDASKIAGHYAHAMEEDFEADYLEKSYYNARTVDKLSYTDNKIREKTFNIKSKLPIHSIFGKIKGAINGFIYGLGNHLPAIVFSAMAILGKGWAAKAGAVGLGVDFIIKILREGFSIGKSNPMK